MESLGLLLAQFVLRLGIGTAAAMLALPSRQTASGFFRVQHLILLGLATLAGLAVYSNFDAFAHPRWLLGTIGALAALSYVGMVLWLYESRRAGLCCAALLTPLFAAAALGAEIGPRAASASNVPSATNIQSATNIPSANSAASPIANTLATNVPLWPRHALRLADAVTSGLLLGGVLSTMLLGHWYLNAPGMRLTPFFRALLGVGAAWIARAAFCGMMLAATLAQGEPHRLSWWMFLTFRWLAGIVLVAALCWLARQTLLLPTPNTQSATGILYAAVVLAFLGELTGRMLSAAALYPL